MLPPEDEFTVTRDPARRRRAGIAGGLVASAIVVGVIATFLTRQPVVRPVVTGRASPTALPVLTPTPVPGQPLTGSRYSAVADPSAHQVLVVGGIDSNDTTWLWDGSRWTLAHPATRPPGRFGASSAYDPVTHTVMLYGGRMDNGELLDDTWAWDGTTWTQLSASGPGLAEGGVMAWNDTSQAMVLVGMGKGMHDQTLVWNGSAWVRQLGGDLPAGVSLVAMVADPGGGLLGVACCPQGQDLTSTWTWRDGTWRQLATHTQPGFTVALALDPPSGRLLLFGAPFLDPGSTLWAWTGSDWQALATRLPAFPEAVVSDSTSGHTLLVGSVIEAVQGNPQPVHVWSLTGSAWRELGQSG